MVRQLRTRCTDETAILTNCAFGAHIVTRILHKNCVNWRHATHHPCHRFESTNPDPDNKSLENIVNPIISARKICFAESTGYQGLSLLREVLWKLIKKCSLPHS